MQNQNIKTYRMEFRGQTLTLTGMSGSFNPPPTPTCPLLGYRLVACRSRLSAVMRVNRSARPILAPGGPILALKWGRCASHFPVGPQHIAHSTGTVWGPRPYEVSVCQRDVSSLCGLPTCPKGLATLKPWGYHGATSGPLRLLQGPPCWSQGEHNRYSMGSAHRHAFIYLLGHHIDALGCAWPSPRHVLPTTTCPGLEPGFSVACPPQVCCTHPYTLAQSFYLCDAEEKCEFCGSKKNPRVSTCIPNKIPDVPAYPLPMLGHPRSVIWDTQKAHCTLGQQEGTASAS